MTAERRYRLSKRKYIRIALSILVVVVASCNVLDLGSGVGYVVYPSTYEAILGAAEQPAISFDAGVDRTSVEAIFQVEDGTGPLSGVYDWDGNTVAFRAEPALESGERYTLTFSGVFRSSSGREHDVANVVPFYMETSDSDALEVIRVEPASGSTIGRDDTIRIVFSVLPEQTALEERISFSPLSSPILERDEATSSVVLRSDDPWENGTTYQLRIGAELAAADSRPLTEAYEATYLSQDDEQRPAIESIVAVTNELAGGYPALAGSLSVVLGPEDGIAITFSEDMDRTETQDAVSVFPLSSITTTWFTERRLIVFPPEPWDPEVDYVLSIADTAVDIRNNALAAGTTVPFRTAPRPDVEITAEIIDVDAPPSQIVNDAAFSNNTPILIDAGLVPGSIQVRITFTNGEFDTDEDRSEISDSINIQAAFPPDIGSPIRTGLTWESSTSVLLQYEGFEATTDASEPNYFWLIVGSGAPIRASNGAILREERRQLMEEEP